MILYVLHDFAFKANLRFVKTALIAIYAFSITVPTSV